MQSRHHTSICDQMGPQQELALTTSEKGDRIFPVVNLKVNVVERRVLINTGAGSSYILVNRIGLLKIKPVNVEVKQVDMLMGTSMACLETYETSVTSVCGNFKMNVNLIKVEKGELLTIDNYEAVIAKYTHLKGVKVHDRETKPQLPIHVVLGAGKYARIKTGTRPQVGREEPHCWTHQTRVVRDVPWTGVWSDSDDANWYQLEYEELCQTNSGMFLCVSGLTP